MGAGGKWEIAGMRPAALLVCVSGLEESGRAHGVQASGKFIDYCHGALSDQHCTHDETKH